MGLVNNFLNQELFNHYNFKNFVETGTGRGQSLRYSMNFGFEKIYSLDIDPVVIQVCLDTQSDSRVKIFVGDSNELMKGICESIKSNTFFWLDAHFPCCYTENTLRKTLDKT